MYRSSVKTFALYRLIQPASLSALIALGVASLFLASLASGGANRIENLYLDAWHRFADKRFTPQHVALVMIDDASLARHADTPLVFWTPLFAQAIGTLRSVGARVIVLDFIFSGSPEQWLAKLGVADSATVRQYDRGFRSELNRGNVLIAGYRIGPGNSPEDFILPSPDFLLSLPEQNIAAHVGLANLTLDSDSVVRHFRTRLPAGADAQGLPEFTLGALAAQAAGATLPDDLSPRPIRYAGPPGSVPHISFMRLLEPDASHDPDLAALRGKIVIVGAGYAGMNDVHPTPYTNVFGAGDRLMSGPEIQANIVETLVSGSEPRSAPSFILAVAVILTAGSIAFVVLRHSLTGGLLVAGLLGLATTIVAYRAFVHGWNIPIAQIHFAMLSALLFSGLGKLSRTERERQHIKAIFGRYVSPAVLQTLVAHPEMPELGGAKREVTVLFSDIRNFTTISETLPPEEVVELLNRYFERVCAVLLAEGAMIDKFIGDAVMVEFGAPLEQPDRADRALRSAVAMLAVAQEFSLWMKERFPDRALPAFQIGIGIHSGPAVVGNIGSRQRMEYTAIGDTVNTASRLEGMTKTVNCPVLASMATVAALCQPAAFHLGRCHRLSVKGRLNEIEAVEIWPDQGSVRP